MAEHETVASEDQDGDSVFDVAVLDRTMRYHPIRSEDRTFCGLTAPRLKPVERVIRQDLLLPPPQRYTFPFADVLRVCPSCWEGMVAAGGTLLGNRPPRALDVSNIVVASLHTELYLEVERPDLGKPPHREIVRFVFFAWFLLLNYELAYLEYAYQGLLDSFPYSFAYDLIDRHLKLFDRLKEASDATSLLANTYLAPYK